MQRLGRGAEDFNLKEGAKMPRLCLDMQCLPTGAEDCNASRCIITLDEDGHAAPVSRC